MRVLTSSAKFGSAPESSSEQAISTFPVLLASISEADCTCTHKSVILSILKHNTNKQLIYEQIRTKRVYIIGVDCGSPLVLVWHHIPKVPAECLVQMSELLS